MLSNTLSPTQAVRSQHWLLRAIGLATTAGLLLAADLNLVSAADTDKPLRVGFAEVDITPPLGTQMAGYYHERLAQKTRDPLKAKAVVLRQGNTAAAFIVTDLIGIAHDLTVQVRQQVEAATGIPQSSIMLSATHTHTAPDYTGLLYHYLKQEPAERDSTSYPAKLLQALVDAVTQADQKAQSVVLTAGAGQQSVPVSFNRRFVMKDGSVRTWQSLSNQQVVRAAGPIDPEIGLLQFTASETGRPLGIISNFALHLDTVGGTAWSADYPFYIEQRLREHLGQDLISVFGTGACGDINHSDPTRKERNTTDIIGNALADTIQATLPALQTVATPDLRVRSTIVHVPLQEVSVQELRRSEELVPLAKAGGKVEFFDLVSAYKAVMLEHMQQKKPRTDTESLLTWGLTHSWAGIGSTLPVDVTTITLGSDVAIVFLPGEVFVELGLAIKQASPFRTTLILELSNCVETIYIPTRAAYAGGSYEVTNSSLQPGSGEMLVEAALKLLRECAAEKP
jgi:neutral ceramidase